MKSNRLEYPIGFHLWPGVPGAIAYLVFAAVLSTRGLPNILALMLAVLLVGTPVCWAIIVRQVRRETGGRFSFRAAFPWLDPVPVWVYLVIGVPVIALSVGIMGGLGSTLQPLLIERLFSWVPAWFVMQLDPASLFGLSRPLLLTLWLLSLVSLVTVGFATVSR